MIQFSSKGDTFDGYLSTAVQGSGPGVIVLQEWWGLVDHIKDICDRLANSGFTALAPDLYRGKTTVEPDEAASLMQALNIAETEGELAGAIEYLRASDSVVGESVGIVGFCMGGQLAMFAAGANPTIRAAANFYGIHPAVHPNYSAIKGEVLGIFAEEDAYASPVAVELLGKELRAYGVIHNFRTFAGVHHAFFNDTRAAVYNAQAAQEAWNMLLDLFDRKLN